MEQALLKLNELVGTLQQRISYYSQLVKDTNVRAEKRDVRDAEFSSKIENLIAREAKIKPGESAATLMELAVKEKKEADDGLADLNKSKGIFNNETLSSREAIAKEQHKLFLDKAKSEKELVMIQKEWEALKKEKEVWKNKFFESLVTASLKNK